MFSGCNNNWIRCNNNYCCIQISTKVNFSSLGTFSQANKIKDCTQENSEANHTKAYRVLVVQWSVSLSFLFAPMFQMNCKPQSVYTKTPGFSGFQFHLPARACFTSSTCTCRREPMRCNLYTLNNSFAGKSTFPPQNQPQSPVLSKICLLLTGRLDRVSCQQSFFSKNSWERRYTERQNSRHGPPRNCTKTQVRVDSSKGE